ncbi:MAG: sigma-70 family RNA polymerase sigma factor [Lachnospiraceae bacterium]|nr:sigma-70 family RNA polymerase sigma factor [Lachnospiraceae bacterium]
MEQSSSEKQSRIRKQFDSFCKTLLKNEMIDYERERSYRLKHEVSFSELTQEELSRMTNTDEYIVESEVFRVLDYDVEVKDELIGEALKYLPEKKRNVILLSFFMDMTDTEIAKHMNLVRSTIHHHRVSSLQALKQIMEGIRNGENK